MSSTSRLLCWLHVAFAVTALSSALPSVASDANYPTKPVRLLVGYGAGTAGDVVARLIATKLQDTYRHGVVVENRPGAGGQIAAQETVRAVPDGHTLMMGAMPQFSIAPAAGAKLGHDPQRDFAPVTQVVTTDLALIVNPQRVPTTSIQEFLAWGKSQPTVFFGTSGPGTVGHLGSYFLADVGKLRIEPVHFKNTSDAMASMLQGDLHAWFVPFAVAAPQVKAGKLKVLLVTGPERAPMFPDAPTAAEAGYPSVQFTSWYGVVAPAATPPAVIDKLNADIVNAAHSAEVRRKIEESGSRVTATSRRDFGRLIADDAERWGKAVKASGFRTQD